MMQEKKLEDLIWDLQRELRGLGLSMPTVTEYSRLCSKIQRLHELRGLEHFDRDVVSEFVADIERRNEDGTLGKSQYGLYLRAARILTEFHDTGKVDWTIRGKVSKFALNDYYEKLLGGLLGSQGFHPNTRGDVVWVCRKYFAWLIGEGHKDLSQVDTAELRGFMVHCSRHMAVNSLRNIQLHLRKLYDYLTAEKIVDAEYVKLLTVPLNKQAKLYPATSREEINRTLYIIDRHTVRGKRDYAIILLGVVTGLRAADIAKLRFRDIDWAVGEIQIVQSKTDGSHAMPLTTDVGEALRDYILNGRQKSAIDRVFLCMKAPLRGFKDAVAIEDIYDDYRIKAGMPRNAFDGKGFHSLAELWGGIW